MEIENTGLVATRRLARYAVETTYTDLPKAVVEQAKCAIRDSLGCILGGSSMAAAFPMRDVILSMAADGLATVVGTRRRVSPPLAGHINAQLANVLDYDDTMADGDPGHPGATVIPSALALAEQHGASGKEFLTAVVVGYDVYSRVARAGQPTPARSRQVRGMATWQVFGAVAAAANILRLDPDAAARAFGLAALHAPVPFLGKFYEERPIWALKNNFGWATMGGLLAAQYAAEGLEANQRILEGQTGFWAMAGSDHCDFTRLTEALGQEFRILDTSFKPYPCCRFTHSALDAIDHLLRAGEIQVEEIGAVSIYSTSKVRVFADYRPQTFTDAQFSLPYLAAVQLLRVPSGYEWVTADRWHEPVVLSLADRVRLEVDPGMDVGQVKGLMPARVKISLVDGCSREAEVAYARGHPKNPLPAADFRLKFLSLAEPVVGLRMAEHLDALIERLEGMPDITELAHCLAGGAARDGEPI